LRAASRSGGEERREMGRGSARARGRSPLEAEARVERSGRSWERRGLTVSSTEREGGSGRLEEEDADRQARPVSG